MGKPGIDFPGLGVGLAILRDGKLLLYKRMLPPEAGFWNIVGGKVDHMEPAEQAARREAEEETGLTIGHIELLGPTEQIIEADRQHWISLLYVARNVEGRTATDGARTSFPISAGSAAMICRSRFRLSRKPPLRP